MGIDLEAYRVERGWSYEELARWMGVPSISQARRYALGEEKLADHRLDHVLTASGGKIDLYALHVRRMSWLKENGAPARVPDVSGIIGEGVQTRRSAARGG